MKKLNCSELAKVAAIVSGLALPACDGAGPPDEHHEPVGAELVVSGQVIASYDAETGMWTGELEVDVGEETAHIAVRFVDEEGDAIVEEDAYLEVDIEDESIAEWEQDTPGEFGGHLHGVSEGETDVTFKLMHGEVGSGHPDFVTQPVHAHVEAHED